jgi:MinD-like ATPase involved in chromosome partitioning or flagellar assembly
MKRILTVSSGKGGVGKTTFAVNFALSLSTAAPTVLVDLDTGTSSVRNSIDVPVERDLYHFLRKGTPLEQCVTRLPESLDRRGRFRNFGFVAAPRHLIEEITNFGEGVKASLVAAINRLPATYVVLDLRAGLDRNVIDFLPYSNSGVLVFTPHLPAATLAASDIVKAILFRKLRIIFSEESPFYAHLPEPARYARKIRELLDVVDDVYDESIRNLDDFLVRLAGEVDDPGILERLAATLEDFRVYYVLNMFNGVRESYETAIAPFVSNIVEHVSSRINITNLGWILRSDRIHDANCRRVPALLTPEPVAVPAPRPAARRELEELGRQYLNLRLEPPSRRPIAAPERPADPRHSLDRQLDSLRAMYADQKNAGVRENFSYITHRALHLIEAMPPSEFGETRICRPEEILSHFFPGDRFPAAF